MEYAFELALCQHLEKNTDWIVARQLGGAVAKPGNRIVDIVGIKPGPQFDKRARITAETIPPPAIESDVHVAAQIPVTEAFDCAPERANEITDAAVDRGFFSTEYRDGRRLVRQTTSYPADWFDGLVAIENKPDLKRPGDLARQLRVDVSLGLFDTVVLATESHVTGAHLNRFPNEVGVWRFDPDSSTREVIREAEPLHTAAPAVEPVSLEPTKTSIEFVPPEAKARKRRRVAERAYGKGWRPEFPACARCTPTADGRPYCTHFDRVVNPERACGSGCLGFDPADPPEFDTAALRTARTPWVRDPPGTTHRQTGLDRFVE